MKKAAKIIVIIIGIIGILIAVVFMMTAGITDTATEFFTDIKAKNYSKAYSGLSEEFRVNTSQDEFVKFLDKSALLKFKDTSWGTRSISGGKGTLDGSVITESGGVVPIKLGLVKENDNWKIYSIYKPKAGLSQSDESGRLPSTEELIALTEESLMKFAESVNAKSFEVFHAYSSSVFQKELSVETLNNAFKEFIDQKINLIPALKTNKPQFDAPPSINSQGNLILEGKYPTRPSRLVFKLSYVYEGVNWKPSGIMVDLTK